MVAFDGRDPVCLVVERAEAMELEFALRAKEAGMLEEGDASGQQLASARRLRSLLSSNRWEPLTLRSYICYIRINVGPQFELEKFLCYFYFIFYLQ